MITFKLANLQETETGLILHSHALCCSQHDLQLASKFIISELYCISSYDVNQTKKTGQRAWGHSLN